MRFPSKATRKKRSWGVTGLHAALTLAMLALVLVSANGDQALASHGWFTPAGLVRHWADGGGTLDLRFGDNVDAAWRTRLQAKLTDLTLESWNWVASLNPSTVAGDPAGSFACPQRPLGVEVCNNFWGSNNVNWPYPSNTVGVAEVTTDIKAHFLAARIRLNESLMDSDDVFRRWVLCQEIGHTLGLDHRSEAGTCMKNPAVAGQSANDQPDAHDHQYVDGIYFGHNDVCTTECVS